MSLSSQQLANVTFVLTMAATDHAAVAKGDRQLSRTDLPQAGYNERFTQCQERARTTKERILQLAEFAAVEISLQSPIK